MENLTVSLPNLAGAFGVAFYLGSYAALQFGLVRGQGYFYPCLNMCAAALVLYSLIDNFNLPSAAIQVSWIAISTFGIARFFIRSRKNTYSQEQQRLVDSKLTTLQPHQVRRFLNAGTWGNFPEGLRITEQGFPVERLVYVLNGGANMQHDGTDLPPLAADSFIGEFTILKGGPATASVQLNQPSRCFCIDAMQVRTLARSDPAFERMLEGIFSSEIAAKIAAMNAAVSRGETPAGTIPSDLTEGAATS